MKFAVFLSILIFCTVTVHEANAQKKSKSIVFKPIGLSKNGEHLEGQIGGYHLNYENPCPIIDAPGNDLIKIKIDWVKLLNSSIKSLLFEHKNYPDDKTISRYSTFASGNYSIIDEQILSIANKFVLPNRFILNQLYQWSLPYYKSTFSALTIEEQQIQYNNLLIAEKYVQLVLEKKDEKKFKQWLLENNLSEDEKIISFLQRRLDKHQWTINDCKYWIEKFKTDFLPELKNPNDIASHFQVTDTITDNLLVVCNHQGDFSLVNKNYGILTDQNYRLILRKTDEIYAYRSNESNDYRIYSISNIRKTGKLDDFPHKEWNSYFPITDTSFLFTTTKYKGIYDHKNKKNIIDSCRSLNLIQETNLFIADKEHYGKVELDTSNHDPIYDEWGNEIKDRNNYYAFSSTGSYLYDFNIKQICNEEIYIDKVGVYGLEGRLFYKIYLELTQDKRFLFFKNSKEKYGVINLTGKTIVPFKYDEIDFANYPKEIIAILNTGEKEVFKME